MRLGAAAGGNGARPLGCADVAAALLQIGEVVQAIARDAVAELLVAVPAVEVDAYHVFALTAWSTDSVGGTRPLALELGRGSPSTGAAAGTCTRRRTAVPLQITPSSSRYVSSVSTTSGRMSWSSDSS